VGQKDSNNPPEIKKRVIRYYARGYFEQVFFELTLGHFENYFYCVVKQKI